MYSLEVQVLGNATARKDNGRTVNCKSNCTARNCLIFTERPLGLYIACCDVFVHVGATSQFGRTNGGATSVEQTRCMV
jgi:hypothetical protein